MTRVPPVHPIVQFDDCDHPVDVIDALVLGAFMTGEQPWSRTGRLPLVRAGATLLPAGVIASRDAHDPNRRALLAEGEGWTVRAVRWSDESAEVTVTAVDAAIGRPIYDEIVEAAAAPATPCEEDIVLGFWHLSARGPLRHERRISAAPWEQIRPNCTRTAARALDQLMAVTGDRVNGRLVLLHGPPGTGKTTALRALARAWAPWCQVDAVLDPERLLADPSYLLTPALEGPDQNERWRLLILEDCDELIRADAKQGTGQSLARLLNLTDGLLGQGVNLLVAITTNEAVGRLHAAVVRPGRCLAQIEVGPLTPAEAAAWLGRSLPRTPSGATLADLYARRDGTTSEPPPLAAVPGQYL